MIRSRQNQVIKNIRALRRRQGDHALLEGPHLLEEALRAGLPLETVLVTSRFAERAAGVALLDRLAEPPLLVEEGILSGLCDADSPQGVLAVCRLPRGGGRDLPRRHGAVYLYLDGVQEPGNVGAIARVAEAFGAAGLALAKGAAHPNHPRALRASAGSLLRLPTACGSSIADLDTALNDLAPTWIGLVARGGEAVSAASLRGTVVLVVGAEGGGVSAEALARLDRKWTLPLRAPVESLNVAVAVGVVLFDLQRERLGNG